MDSMGSFILSGCHRFCLESVVVACDVRSTPRTYVQERLCCGIFLQVHLVHIFQSFDPHDDDDRLVVSDLVDVVR